jgi:hypothetical protein
VFPAGEATVPEDKDRVPVLFTITGPTGAILVPESLVLNVNPTQIAYTFVKKKELLQTRGGWVEQYFADEIDEVAGDITSGAFMNIQEGLAKQDPFRTLAYDRMLDFVELYKNNGCIYDIAGKPVFRGSVSMVCDIGVLFGYFTDLNLVLSEDAPALMSGDFRFKVEHPIWVAPGFASTRSGFPGVPTAPVRR